MMRRLSPTGLLLGVLVATLTAQAQPCYAAQSRIMHVLAMGEIDLSSSPIKGFCAAEPSLDCTLVVARTAYTGYDVGDVKRMIRLYIPRNMEAMLEYDFILIDQATILFFSVTSLEQMRSAIADYGKGGLCFMESQYYDIYGPWLETELSKCFPYDHWANIAAGHPSDENYDLQVVKDDPNLPPLLTAYVPLGIESVRPFGGSRPTYPKEGATVWVYCVTYGRFGRYPLFISWRYGPGKGLVWTTANQFGGPMWLSFDGKERFALDIFTGIVWLSSGWDLTDDPLWVRNLRISFTTIRVRATATQSLIEFVDMYGANTRHVEEELARMLEINREAGELYLDHDFESCDAKLTEAMDLAGEIERACMALRDKALFWVYVIEWLAVTSTMTLAMIAVWSLMVRRKLYREVAHTRTYSDAG